MRTEHLQDLSAVEALAVDIAETLKPGAVVCLIGDLGAGKTTFSQFLCKALGVDTYVTSPTFNLMNVYDARDGLEIYHFDAYRLSDPDEIGMDDYLYGKGIAIVEWANLIEEWMPENALWISLEVDGESRRRVTFSGAAENKNHSNKLGGNSYADTGD